MVDIDVRLSSHLKEELAWAVDKQLQVICYFKSNRSTKKLKGTKTVLNLNSVVCVAMWPLVMHSNYFLLAMTFLVL